MEVSKETEDSQSHNTIITETVLDESIGVAMVVEIEESDENAEAVQDLSRQPIDNVSEPKQDTDENKMDRKIKEAIELYEKNLNWKILQEEHIKIGQGRLQYRETKVLKDHIPLYPDGINKFYKFCNVMRDHNIDLKNKFESLKIITKTEIEHEYRNFDEEIDEEIKKYKQINQQVDADIIMIITHYQNTIKKMKNDFKSLTNTNNKLNTMIFQLQEEVRSLKERPGVLTPNPKEFDHSENIIKEAQQDTNIYTPECQKGVSKLHNKVISNLNEIKTHIQEDIDITLKIQKRITITKEQISNLDVDHTSVAELKGLHQNITQRNIKVYERKLLEIQQDIDSFKYEYHISTRNTSNVQSSISSEPSTSKLNLSSVAPTIIKKNTDGRKN